MGRRVIDSSFSCGDTLPVSAKDVGELSRSSTAPTTDVPSETPPAPVSTGFPSPPACEDEDAGRFDDPPSLHALPCCWTPPESPQLLLELLVESIAHVERVGGRRRIANTI